MAKESYMLAQIVYSQLAETKCALNMAGYYLELSAEQALKHLYDDTEIPRSIQWLAIRIPADNPVAKTGILEMQDMINTWRDCTTSMRKEDIERGLNVVGRLLKEVEAYARTCHDLPSANKAVEKYLKPHFDARCLQCVECILNSGYLEVMLVEIIRLPAILISTQL